MTETDDPADGAAADRTGRGAGDGADGRSSLTAGRSLGRLERWVLFTGNRWAVTLALLAAVFLSFVGLALAWPYEADRLLRPTAAARQTFTALLRGAILVSSIVVSINAIVLSQEMRDVGSQRDRVEGSIEYRRRIEDLIEADVSPTEPGDFLAAILSAITRETGTLSDMARSRSDEAFRSEVDEFVRTVRENVAASQEMLGSADAGTFDVLLAGLDYDYSTQLTAARRIRREYGDGPDAEVGDVLGDLIDTLEFFAIGREYFKSLYYKRELARLSKALLYVSLPIIVVTSVVILAMDGQAGSAWTTWGPTWRVAFVGLAYTIAVTPFAVLTAYVLRLAAISLRTLAAGPFVIDDGKSSAVDWPLSTADLGLGESEASASESEDEDDRSG